MAKSFFSKHALLLILLVIFLLPGVLALWFYHHPQVFKGQTTNQGELLAKPVFVAELAKSGQWGIVLWYPSACKKACKQAWEMLHTMRLALGRRYYQTALYRLSDDLSQQQVPAIFLSDKRGYLILRYPLNSKPEPIFKDLEHLIRGSE